MPRQSTCFDFCTSAEFGRRTRLCRDRQCGQVPGTRKGTFPSLSSRCCLRYSAHAFSSARVWSFEAISNRPNANSKARTLTWGSAARPVVPHLRQVMIGVWMLRPVRIRRSIPSSSSRKLMSVGIDTPWCHFECNRTTHFRKPGSLCVARRHFRKSPHQLSIFDFRFIVVALQAPILWPACGLLSRQQPGATALAATARSGSQRPCLVGRRAIASGGFGEGESSPIFAVGQLPSGPQYTRD